MEGLYSRTRNPISEALALQGARLLSEALPAMAPEPGNPDGRAALLVGANLSGMVLVNAPLPAIAEHVMGDRGLCFNPRRAKAAEEVEATPEQAW